MAASAEDRSEGRLGTITNSRLRIATSVLRLSGSPVTTLQVVGHAEPTSVFCNLIESFGWIEALVQVLNVPQVLPAIRLAQCLTQTP